MKRKAGASSHPALSDGDGGFLAVPVGLYARQRHRQDLLLLQARTVMVPQHSEVMVQTVDIAKQRTHRVVGRTIIPLNASRAACGIPSPPGVFGTQNSDNLW